MATVYLTVRRSECVKFAEVDETGSIDVTPPRQVERRQGYIDAAGNVYTKTRLRNIQIARVAAAGQVYKKPLFGRWHIIGHIDAVGNIYIMHADRSRKVGQIEGTCTWGVIAVGAAHLLVWITGDGFRKNEWYRQK